MRTVPAHILTSHSIATLVKVERTDGTIHRFTDHDVAITYTGDGTYEPANFLGAGSLASSLGSGVDNSELLGAINSDEITEADLLGRKFDGAVLSIYTIDYTVPDSGRVVRFVGRIGEIRLTDGSAQFTAEAMSLSQLLRQKLGLKTTPTCICRRLGDAQCKVSLAGNTVDGHAVRVTGKSVGSVTDSRNLVISSETATTGYFDRGTITFTSGVLDGLEFEIKTHTKSGSTAVLVLRSDMPELPTAGDTATLIAGCQRRFTEDCVGKFNNGLNFHGFPHVPGNDTVGEVGRSPT